MRKAGKRKLTRNESRFLKLYKASPGLTMYVRNFTKPGGRSPCFVIVVPGIKDRYGCDKRFFIRMDRLFEVLGLDLEKLSQIFVEKPWEYYVEPGAKVIQPTAKSYSDLGICRAWDDEGWQNLAKLMEKNILQIHEIGGDPPDFFERAIFYSDGRFNILNPDTVPEFNVISLIAEIQEEPDPDSIEGFLNSRNVKWNEP